MRYWTGGWLKKPEDRMVFEEAELKGGIELKQEENGI